MFSVIWKAIALYSQTGSYSWGEKNKKFTKNNQKK